MSVNLLFVYCTQSWKQVGLRDYDLLCFGLYYGQSPNGASRSSNMRDQLDSPHSLTRTTTITSIALACLIEHATQLVTRVPPDRLMIA